MAARVILTPGAQNEAIELPRTIQGRLTDIVERLANWPAVSGAKPLRNDLAGNDRIRTGAYRVVFTVSADGNEVTIWKIGHRGGVYD